MRSPDPIDPAGARTPLAACFGGGGAFGFGFNMGVADGLRERGIDLRRWPLVGTSAGAHAAATLRTDLTFDAVAEIWETYIEAQTRRFWVSAHELADPIYGGREASDVGAVAVRLLTLRRHVLRSEDHHLADIVAASSSVLPIVRPHRIDGKRYVDGGTISLASADLAPAADLLLLVTPFASKGQGLAGRAGAWQARREIRSWTRRHRGDVLHVAPSRAMAALGGRRLREVGEMSIGRAVYPLAVDLGRRAGDELARSHPHLIGGADGDAPVPEPIATRSPAT